MTSLLGIFLIATSDLIYQKHTMQRHMTIQLRNKSLNQKINEPDEASRMICDTVAIKI